MNEMHAYIRNLGQINLVNQMLITQPILCSLLPTSCPPTERIQPFTISPVRHLHIHTDPPVERRSRAVHIHVRDPGFDDLLEHLSRFLVRGYAYPCFVPGVQRLADGGWEEVVFFCREFVEAIAFTGVNVFEGDANVGGIGQGGRVMFGADEDFVKEAVDRTVLHLFTSLTNSLIIGSRKLRYISHAASELDPPAGIIRVEDGFREHWEAEPVVSGFVDEVSDLCFYLYYRPVRSRVDQRWIVLQDHVSKQKVRNVTGDFFVRFDVSNSGLPRPEAG
jgi:hypothetical protein